jgi:HAMP domain-containing protein
MRIYNKLGFRASMTLAIAIVPVLWLTAWSIVVMQSAAAENAAIAKGKVGALTGAAVVSHLLDIGIDEGKFGLEDLLDPKYEEIKYPFQVETRRYHTRFDAYTDTHVTAMQDAALDSSPDFLYATVIDRHGYVPTPNTRYGNEPRGDLKWDRANSRKKQKYETDVHAAAAVFLGNPGRPVLVQLYPRDSGGNAWDVAAPITVKGRHFGAFRIGVSLVQLEAARDTLVVRLAWLFGTLTLVIVIIVIVVMLHVSRPLSNLARQVDAISRGESDTIIKTERTDEVGEVSRSVNRLWVSLSHAMARMQ